MSSSSDRNYYHNQRLNTRAAPTRLPYNSSSSLQPAQLKAVHTNTSKPSRSLITVIPHPHYPQTLPPYDLLPTARDMAHPLPSAEASSSLSILHSLPN
ncbi:hypothetical protein H4Q26_000637 [Puccinia striiformis f. sp. tritici PST-130]|nr:hypothetical protein H4Q26_000637 [Puccinia striiformis f. sp. tritici PST-130]